MILQIAKYSVRASTLSSKVSVLHQKYLYSRLQLIECCCRSLSDKDLDALDTASQAVPERQPVEIVSDGAADEQVPPSAGTSSLMSSESGAHSANSDIVTEVNEGSDADEEIDAAVNAFWLFCYIKFSNYIPHIVILQI